MLIRKTATQSTTSRLTRNVAALLGKTIDRRTFLRRSGIAVGAGVAATQLPFSIVEPAKGAETAPAKTETRHTVCTHCSVGCAVDADGSERRVDSTGSRVRLADQSRLALRQRRRRTRSRHHARFAPAQIPDEARQRQVSARYRGTRRSTGSPRRSCKSARSRAPTRPTSSAHRSTTTSRRS